MTPSNSVAKTREEQVNMKLYQTREAIEEYARMNKLFPVEEMAFKKFLPPAPATVLDIGCGTGRTSHVLAERGYKVTAGDIVPAMVAKAKELYPAVDFRVLDAVALEFPNESFDVVLFSFNGMDLIYPFSSRLKAISEARRVLKPGGIFLYSSHNLRGLCARCKPPYGKFIREQLSFLYHSLAPSLLQGYWRSRDYAEGYMTVYFGRPAKEMGLLKKCGFECLGVISPCGETIHKITYNDCWPYYAARKI